MTPIFNFHYVISGLTIPTTTKTPTSSLVKTSLKTKKRWSDITIFTRPRYKDLLSNLPQEVKADRYCIIVLNRIASYGSVGISDCSKKFNPLLSYQPGVKAILGECQPYTEVLTIVDLGLIF